MQHEQGLPRKMTHGVIHRPMDTTTFEVEQEDLHVQDVESTNEGTYYSTRITTDYHDADMMMVVTTTTGLQANR